MRRLGFLLLLLASPVHASPIALVCSGVWGFAGAQEKFEGIAAELDLEARTFLPPGQEDPFPVTVMQIDEITFGELKPPHHMTLGSILRTTGDYFYTETAPDTPTYGQRGVCKPSKRLF
jgi:hypothetical protein